MERILPEPEHASRYLELNLSYPSGLAGENRIISIFGADRWTGAWFLCTFAPNPVENKAKQRSDQHFLAGQTAV